MLKQQIQLSDFRIMQRKERRTWTAAAVGCAIGATGSAWFTFGQPNTGTMIAALVTGGFLGGILVCFIQIMRITLSELLLDDAGPNRPGSHRP